MIEKNIIIKRPKRMSSFSNRYRTEKHCLTTSTQALQTLQPQNISKINSITQHNNNHKNHNNNHINTFQVLNNNNVDGLQHEIMISSTSTSTTLTNSFNLQNLKSSSSEPTTCAATAAIAAIAFPVSDENINCSSIMDNSGVITLATLPTTSHISSSSASIEDVVKTEKPTVVPPSSNVLSTSINNVRSSSTATTEFLRRRSRKVLPSFNFQYLTSIFSFILLLVGDVQIGGVAAVQHRDLNQNQLKKPEPMFISRSETFKFVAGTTMVLPCEVADTAEFVVAWKRGIAILSAGSVKVTPDPRVRLVNGFNLQIRDAVPQDAGDYICQIAMLEPREITHTVEILVPPRIHHISSGGHLQVKKGASVRIECSASGNPTPNVTWSRKNNILPNGDETLHSTILSVENMDRHKGGVYICKANNGVGQPASSQVVLHVLYPPEISVERPVVYSGEGHEAMLVCIVHGEAQPEVIWFKETMQLDTTERHIMENRGSRHTLIIRKVHPQDFGNYSCVAENQLGKSRKTLQLSGKPNTAVFSSPPISQYKDRYNISWTVDSHTPVEEFKLYFRRLPQGHEVDNTIEQSQPMHLSSSSSLSMHMYVGNNGGGSNGMNGNNNGGNNNINNHNHRGGYNIHWPRSDWRDVVLPAVPLSHHYTQGMSYMIRGLEPDQHYEAKVNARNRYGWSDLTESFLFSTSSNDNFLDPSQYRNLGLSDNEMRDLSVTFYGSSAQSTFSNFFIQSIFWNRFLTIFIIAAVFLIIG